MTAKNLQRVAEGGTYCHVYNRGIENRNIFADDTDYLVFLGYLKDYLSAPKATESTKQEFTINGLVFRGVPHQPKNYFNKIELIAYSLKPDHFHLLLHQKTHKSLQAFIRSLCTRYSMYFNKKYSRMGSLFAGPYKSVIVKEDSSLLLLTRFLHKEGGYSTYPQYSGHVQTPWVKTNIVLSVKNGKGSYQDYVEKYRPNQKEQEQLGAITIEKTDQHLERRDLVKHNLKPWSRIPELAAASAVFVLLLGISVRNIAVAGNGPQNLSKILGIKFTFTPPGPAVSPSPIATPVPTSEPEPKIMLTVKYTNVPINIRKEATTASKIIGQAYEGDKFEFVSEDQDFSQINLSDGSTGFINSQYVEKEEGASND